VSALPRPDLPPGPHRDLNHALHDLHHRAGWPSLRTLAKAAGCSHTTVSKAFSSPQVPSWGLVEVLVEEMDGDTTEFRQLWLAATTQPESVQPRPARIAGRRAELAAVRRHLESGTGLLLVTGEAGIGKTALVTTAASQADSFVAVGHCLPLSTEVPLLAVAEALRIINDHDDGRWLKEALAACPPFVAVTLRRLLPDLNGDETATTGAGGPSMLHLFNAIATVLTFSERTATSVVLEDLHWADSTTLDMVEQLATRPSAPRLVGTWRLDDPGIPEQSQEWFARIRRLHSTVAVELSPLTQDETADQLRLLTRGEPSPELVAGIQARSAGHPLFTEQLAAQDANADMPTVLADLLDRRLGMLEGAEWGAARALGFADRGLGDDVLRGATGLAPDTLSPVLRRLHARRLVVSTESQVRLSHPLLAEAVRRRAMPGEAAEQHRRLATALAASPESTAAEIAVHWQAAGDHAEELTWRVAAAREAGQRLGPTQEAEQWIRALDLWSSDDGVHGTPPLNRVQAALHAMDALWFAGRAEDVDAMAVSLLPRAAELPPRDAARLLAAAARTEAAFRSREKGLRLSEQAVEIFETMAPSTDLLVALRARANALEALGRLSEAALARGRAAEVNRMLGDVDQERLLMAERAWELLEAGQPIEALHTVVAALRRQPPVLDPGVEVTLCKHHSNLLMEAGAPAAEVVEAARRGLALADEGAIDIANVAWLWHDLGLALARSGDVSGAAVLIDPLTEGESVQAHHPLDLVRADLDLRRGRFDDARGRAQRALAQHTPSLDVRNRWCGVLADVELWGEHAAGALEILLEQLDDLVGLDEVTFAGPYFIRAVRAAADLDPGERLWDRVIGLRRRAVRDPFACQPDSEATWAAELGRLREDDAVDRWLRAAAHWDRAGRSHDAAYCRWRGAQVALRSGQATTARRLLQQAARDAVQHVPLTDAINRTAGYAQRS